ncbi:hypothetical protein BT67DRAFT_289663 [Trichocladium antarcticum]|uniref:Uncharacterized protein n=1 Tax=Trichocladium antarcticum TaxID=1450529 RepID=A0AAN6ULC0_9PEZI|nr:hypothetical protein BT67DRAFT_289663 [Trichocladium antarcticum]
MELHLILQFMRTPVVTKHGYKTRRNLPLPKPAPHHPDNLPQPSHTHSAEQDCPSCAPAGHQSSGPVPADAPTPRGRPTVRDYPSVSRPNRHVIPMYLASWPSGRPSVLNDARCPTSAPASCRVAATRDDEDQTRPDQTRPDEPRREAVSCVVGCRSGSFEVLCGPSRRPKHEPTPSVKFSAVLGGGPAAVAVPLRAGWLSDADEGLGRPQTAALFFFGGFFFGGGWVIVLCWLFHGTRPWKLSQTRCGFIVLAIS